MSLKWNFKASLDSLISCKKRKIEFLSSGSDIESLDLLSDLGQKKFKIPSGEITNLPYLKHIAKISNSIILSTGMSNLNEISDAIEQVVSSASTYNQMVDSGVKRSKEFSWKKCAEKTLRIYDNYK